MLTTRQQEVLDFLHDQISRTGIMPSTREIQEHFGFASQTAAVNHLRALERKGVIQRLVGKARAVTLSSMRDRNPLIDIPIFGQIAAGLASFSEQQPDGCVSIDISSLGVRRANARSLSAGAQGSLFALRVRGDSMIEAHIDDGDIVILELREPKSGDIVAALIDGETTLKRYLVKNGKPFLRAENPAYTDLIPAQELVVQGVMVALVRGSRAG